MTVCDINLIAARRRQKQQALALMRLAVYSLIAISLGMLILYGYAVVESRRMLGEIQNYDAQLADPKLTESMERVTFLETKIADLEPRVELLQKVHDSEQAWIRILQDVAACLPPGTWMTEFSSQRVDKGQSISIKGMAAKQADVGEFMLALDKPSWSDVPRLGFSQVTGRQDACDLFNFEITVPLTKNIGSDLK